MDNLFHLNPICGLQLKIVYIDSHQLLRSVKNQLTSPQLTLQIVCRGGFGAPAEINLTVTNLSLQPNGDRSWQINGIATVANPVALVDLHAAAGAIPVYFRGSFSFPERHQVSDTWGSLEILTVRHETERSALPYLAIDAFPLGPGCRLALAELAQKTAQDLFDHSLAVIWRQIKAHSSESLQLARIHELLHVANLYGGTFPCSQEDPYFAVPSLDQHFTARNRGSATLEALRRKSITPDTLVTRFANWPLKRLQEMFGFTNNQLILARRELEKWEIYLVD
jgi:hypothetical protein